MPKRRYALAIVLGAVMGIASVAAAIALDLPLRDPDGTFGPSWVRLPAVLLGCFLVDVVPRVFWRARGWRGAWPYVTEVLKERWTGGRVTLVVIGLGCFYLTYVGYRNLKGFLPFLREEIHDDALARMDRFLFFGHDPATVLHGLLGTDLSAQILSAVYLFYLPFVPISLAAWLVWSRNLSGGLWYATALCLNWVMGLGSYYLIPSQGPAFANPELFWDLADTGVSQLQASLWNSRWTVISDPHQTESVFSIAGFASLHVSVVLMAALMTHIAVRNAWARRAMWVYFVLTVLATVYFGWHYLADDLAGAFIGWFSVWFAGLCTGHSMWANYRGKVFGLGKVETILVPAEPEPQPDGGSGDRPSGPAASVGSH